jgi:hypothetical protein
MNIYEIYAFAKKLCILEVHFVFSSRNSAKPGDVSETTEHIRQGVTSKYNSWEMSTSSSYLGSFVM